MAMAEHERPDERTLIILRHAKAAQPGGVDDLDRPLTARGHADSGAAGAWLAGRGYRPDVVLCSPSKRTRQTWHGIAVALTGHTAVVRYEPALYESGAGEILRLVQAIEPDFGTALLIGHNPTVSLLSALLDPAAGRDSDGLRTCGMAVHRVEHGWGDWGPGRAPVVAGHTARVE
jgi:phosphohistidine phosphatase